ncbi:hypothetical protein [Halalkalibacter flavus]|uniref:hypothetical protein n=1 Tax=Halalkalibacter flavus TaxID=3090668 RepID=UPI002FCBF30A
MKQPVSRAHEGTTSPHGNIPDKDKEVFFYLNEMFVKAIQGGIMVQSTLDLYA